MLSNSAIQNYRFLGRWFYTFIMATWVYKLIHLKSEISFKII